MSRRQRYSTRQHELAERLPRGECPACHRDVALRKGGLLREHREPEGQWTCLGSGRRAVAHGSAAAE